MPTMKSTSRPSSIRVRDIRAPSTVKSGAPTTTPSAYALIIQPACATARTEWWAYVLGQEALGDLRQQAHRDEFGEADGEPAEREREQGGPAPGGGQVGHGGNLRGRRRHAIRRSVGGDRTALWDAYQYSNAVA